MSKNIGIASLASPQKIVHRSSLFWKNITNVPGSWLDLEIEATNRGDWLSKAGGGRELLISAKKEKGIM